jgi:hypothetical protein
MSKSRRWPSAILLFLGAALLALAATGAGAGPAMAETCASDPRLSVVVTTNFAEPAVRSDYTVRTIEALARKLSSAPAAEVFGFYTGEFSYTVDFAQSASCATTTQATVTLRLSNRVIEVGKEFAASSCAAEAVIGHYRKMARADEAEVTRFAQRTASALAASASTMRTVPTNYHEVLGQRIKAIVDEATASLHQARKAAQDVVNEPQELLRVRSSCAV